MGSSWYLYVYPLSKKSGQASLIPWFSAACTAAIVHGNLFFRLYQKVKSSESKVKFRQASNCCKRVLEAAKLAYANKAKEPILSQKLDSHDFWRIANSVLNKVNLLYFLYSMAGSCGILHQIKQNCLLKTFLNFNLELI